jgi:hypothetical protein
VVGSSSGRMRHDQRTDRYLDMAEEGTEPPAQGRPRQADLALALGVTALLGGLAPVVGDALALPLGAAALVTGCVGIRIAERDARPGVGQALVGALLGMCAIGVALIAVIAGGVHPSA